MGIGFNKRCIEGIIGLTRLVLLIYKMFPWSLES